MEKYELGLAKKSFSLFYNGGSIWCEHLDSLCGRRDLLVQKFSDDLEQIRRPSASAFLAVALDETEIDDEFLDFLIRSLMETRKPIQKVAFVGLDRKRKRHILGQAKRLPFAVHCTDDFEKAKQWLL